MYKDKTLDILYVYPADSMYEYVLDTVYYASEHKWIYNGVQIWPRESEPDITLEEYLGVNGTSQEEIEKELMQQVLDILSERWIKANETKSAFTTDNLGIIEIEKSI